MQQLKKGWVLWSGATFLAVEMTKSSYLSINHQPCMHHRAILSWTQRGKTTTRCLSVPIVFIISVLSVFVCEAWLFWFTEKLLDERVPQTSRTPPRSSPAALCACMDTVTHPQCLPLSAPTNRPLNFTHTSNTHTQNHQVFTLVLAATECVSRHNSNRTTFESSPILRKPVGFPGANEMPARQMDMREPQSDPTLGSK